MLDRRSAVLTRSALLVGISAASLLAATPALAQDAGSAVPPANPPTTPTNDQKQAQQNAPNTAPVTGGDAAVTENRNSIVVTGTRIRQPEFTSPDPVQLINPDLSKKAG